VKQPNRRVVVFTTLISVLTLTSALLLALAPAPLTPDPSATLFAVDTAGSMDAVFQTQAAPKQGRWKYIYIHHSRTPGGNALTLKNGNEVADHFVIGNGDGAIDGQIQIGPRWDGQHAALPPAGAQWINSESISICLVGDFDRAVPTPAQLRQLIQLVNTLQGRLDIPATKVVFNGEANSAAGMGRYFPTTAFREQLLP
jgi:N-acetyl-anhydromuramyl-L-alanine amidase AmpD